MSKSSNFFGQPIYGQLIKSLDREKIVEMSRKHGGEKYIKSFDGYTHLLTMLYAVIQRFDSLREIETSMTASASLLRSTLRGGYLVLLARHMSEPSSGSDDT